MYDISEKMKIEVKSIKGNSHESGEDPGITLADKLARKISHIAVDKRKHGLNGNIQRLTLASKQYDLHCNLNYA